MKPLHRHQLAWLRAHAWQRIVASHGDAVDELCLRHWALHGLPVVVTRQPQAVATQPQVAAPQEAFAPQPQAAWAGDVDADPLDEAGAAAAGLVAVAVAAPSRWGRRRLAFGVQPGEILRLGEFPPLAMALPLLANGVRADAERLGAALLACGATARVYGSHGWQALTGLDHLREGSDLDLWVAVAGDAQADAVAEVLEATGPMLPRLDGELCFPDGSAVAWREWRDWRAGRARALLVKTLRDCRLRWSSVAAGACA